MKAFSAAAATTANTVVALMCSTMLHAGPFRDLVVGCVHTKCIGQHPLLILTYRNVGEVTLIEQLQCKMIN